VNAVDWLLDSDPAIRWQAMRDLTDAPPEAVAAERARVAREGTGAKALACQGADGAWHRAYFGHPSTSLAQRLIAEQLDDGGRNCEAPKSARSSFHTTICVLEGLLEYERAAGSDPQIASARRRGERYLLDRALFRRLSTGEVVDPEFLKFAYPPRYHYDILRALDYLRLAGIHPDARIRDAIQIVKSARQADGRGLLDHSYDEALAFPLAESAGGPSRWNTLRALRVLRGQEQGQSESATG
jgi:hypothetical protein